MSVFIFRILFVIGLIGFSNSTHAGFFDLGFEVTSSTYSPWTTNFQNMKLSFDDNLFVEGKRSLSFIYGDRSVKSSGFYFQKIKLPRSTKEINLSVSAKASLSANQAWLKTIFFDKDDNVTGKDSVRLTACDNWTRFHINAPGNNVCCVYIEIAVFSESEITTKDYLHKVINVDQLEISLDGENIISLKDETKIEKEDIVALKTNLILLGDTVTAPYKSMIANAKLIAFGETVHGSKEISEFTFNAFRSIVNQQNAKLILLELPFEMGLRLNSYVNNMSSIDIEKLMVWANYDMVSMVNFLNDLREINKKNNESVVIMGIDTEKSLRKEENLSAFVSELSLNNNKLNNICTLIQKKEYECAIHALNELNSLSVDGPTKECIIYALKLRQMALETPIDNRLRDSIMFSNVVFAINTFTKSNEKVLLYAHYNHVNYKRCSFYRFGIPNLGKYLKQNLKDAFKTIALIVGEGKIASFGIFGMDELRLLPPQNGSVEKLCSLANVEHFYCSSEVISSSYYGKQIGAQKIVFQYQPFSLRSGADGFIYINKCTANRFPESWPKTSFKFKEFLKDNSN